MGTIFQKEADPAKPPLLTEGKIEKPVDNRTKALKEYEEKFKEFEYRCERAAFMNYKTSSDYDRYSQNLEYAAVALGLLSAGLWLARMSQAGKKGMCEAFKKGMSEAGKKTNSEAGKQGMSEADKQGMSEAGKQGVRISKFAGPLTLGASILVEIFAKGNLVPGILPTLRVRAERHTNAGAGWQKLAHDAREYLIRLKYDPDLCPKTCSQWYRDFVKERKDVCTAAIVPQRVYEAFKAEEVDKWQKNKQKDYEDFKEKKKGENSDKADLTVPINDWDSDRWSLYFFY